MVDIYNGGHEDHPPVSIIDDTGDNPVKMPIKFHMQKPDDGTGKQRDQTEDAARHMRYAKTLNLPELYQRDLPRRGSAVIVGGGPSAKVNLDKIKELSKDKRNTIFAVNWTHTWLINNGVIPDACVFFEIDAEPDSVLKAAHEDVTYYICSHCHEKTFDMLEGKKRVLWHSIPNSDGERLVREELFKDTVTVGGGVSTFTRTMTIALHLGHRDFDLFGCDGSYPDTGQTHVDGYETVMNNDVDGFWAYAKNIKTGEMRRFRTMGYLALQVEEFKIYTQANHQHFTMHVHGDSLIRYAHEAMFPGQYING